MYQELLKKKWEKLPESYKNAVKSAAEELFQRSTDYTDDEANEIEARRKLESQGVDWLVDFSASDQRAFLDAAAETWKEAANDAGGDALNNRARILKAIGRQSISGGITPDTPLIPLHQ